jgi:hypothetical protein
MKGVMEYTRLNKLTNIKAKHDLVIHVAGYAGLRPAPAGPITSLHPKMREEGVEVEVE